MKTLTAVVAVCTVLMGILSTANASRYQDYPLVLNFWLTDGSANSTAKPLEMVAPRVDGECPSDFVYVNGNNELCGRVATITVFVDQEMVMTSSSLKPQKVTFAPLRYRWRDGKAESFIMLRQTTSTFMYQIEVDLVQDANGDWHNVSGTLRLRDYDGEKVVDKRMPGNPFPAEVHPSGSVRHIECRTETTTQASLL